MHRATIILACCLTTAIASLLVCGGAVAEAFKKSNLSQLFPANAPCRSIRDIPNLVAPEVTWQCNGAAVIPLSLATQLNGLPIPHLKLESVAEVAWKTPSDSSRDLIVTIRIYSANVSQAQFRSATETLSAQGNLVRADLNAPIKRTGSWGFEDNGGAVFGSRNVLVSIDPGTSECTTSCSSPTDAAMAHAARDTFAKLGIA